MISRYAVSLNDIELDSLDDNLLILNVEYSPLERSIRKYQTADLNGYDIADIRVNQRTVTVTFELHIYDIAERNKACQTVNAWAENGGKLRLNDREDVFLWVSCDTLAEVSARDWTAPLTLVFVSSYSPYFLSDEETVKTLSGKSASGSITLDGNTGDALVSVEATAEAGVTSFQATVGDTTVKLTGLNIASGQKLVIDYIHERFLRITANGQSVMAKLSPTSSDNLKAKCGETSRIAYTASNKVTAVFKARGCWR